MYNRIRTCIRLSARAPARECARIARHADGGRGAGPVTVRLHDGYASISPVTDQSEHSILISIEQILISIERSARYELVLVPVDGHTVLGYRTSAAVAGGKRAAWAAGDKVDGRLSAVAEVRAHALKTGQAQSAI